MNSSYTLKQLAEHVTAAAVLDQPEHRGMMVDVLGVLSHASRALKALAVPPSTTNESVLDEHEDRLSEEQPALHAHMLEQLAQHLEKVFAAIQAGDVRPLRQFLDVYRVS